MDIDELTKEGLRFAVFASGGETPIAMCCAFEDAVVLAKKYSGAYITDRKDDVDYYRQERLVIEYLP